MTPPSRMPITKKKFHISFFQSYLKNGMFAGIQAAQAWRKFALMPKFLLPKISSAGTVRPTNGPATYQGQGCLINSRISIIVYFDANLGYKNTRVCTLCHTTNNKAAACPETLKQVPSKKLKTDPYSCLFWNCKGYNCSCFAKEIM